MRSRISFDTFHLMRGQRQAPISLDTWIKTGPSSFDTWFETGFFSFDRFLLDIFDVIFQLILQLRHFI